MSTITATHAAPVTERPTGRGLSFGRLLHVELRKQVDTRAGRGLLVAIAVLSLGALAGVLWFSRHDGAGFTTLVQTAAIPQGMLIPVLGIITACNEWSQRTALVTFTQEPRRWRVIAAKTLAAIIWATGFLLLAWGVAALAHAASMGAAGNPVHFDLTGRDYLAGWIEQVVGVLMGLAFGFLVLVTPAAIAAYFIVPSLVTGLVMGVPALRRFQEWVSTTTPPMSADPIDPVTDPWARFATSMLFWVVIPFSVGVVRVLRREVK
ncbi:hypothetical protein GCM10027030_07710 [Luteococcus sediminum]|uniref:hypothetical protein n=1 Tax=Luteococcus sp. TaxID=1969402 RepID=UPI003735728F